MCRLYNTCVCVQWCAIFFSCNFKNLLFVFILCHSYYSCLVLREELRFFFFFKSLLSGSILSTLPTFYTYKAHQVITLKYFCSKSEKRPISCYQSSLRKIYLSYFPEDNLRSTLLIDVMKRNF